MNNNKYLKNYEYYNIIKNLLYFIYILYFLMSGSPRLKRKLI